MSGITPIFLFFDFRYSLQDPTAPIQAPFPLKIQFKISTKGSKNRILKSAA